MSAITAAKVELAAAIGATVEALESLNAGEGAVALAYVPETLPTPCVVLEGSDPYLSTEGASFDPNEYLLNLRVFALVALNDNEQATEDLDALTEATIPAITAAGWQITNVGTPGPVATTTDLTNGVAISVRKFITLV